MAKSREDIGMELVEKSETTHLQTAEIYIQQIRDALKKGHFLLARELMSEGITNYPNHHEMKKLHRVIAPPEAKDGGPASNTSWTTNREWLKVHWDEYKGKWVALRHGNLIDSSPSLIELVQQIGRSEDVFFSRVG